MNLNETERQAIEFQMEHIASIAKQLNSSPFDPKIEVALELAHALLKEQLDLDKKYEKWGSPPAPDDKFLGDTENIPSAEDIRRMIEGE
jgi:hypothetical protein